MFSPTSTWRLVAMCCLLGLSLPGHAGPTAQDLARVWDSWQPMLQAHAVIPVQLDAHDLQRVADGDVARHRTQLDGVDRVVGATWSDQPRDALWIAILDDGHDTLVDGLTEIHLRSHEPRQKLLFQHVHLPWPFLDRQWVIDIRNNADLAHLSHGAVWERTWSLAIAQQTEAQQIDRAGFPAPDAIWTPLNQGGWLLIDAADGTLLVYHGRADVGGVIPDDLSTRFALSTLKGMMRHVVDRAAVIPAHYDAQHDPILRPDGSAVPAWSTPSNPQLMGNAGTQE